MKQLFERVWNSLRQMSWAKIKVARFQTAPVVELPHILNTGHLYVLGGERPWSAAFLCPCGCRQPIHLSLLPDETPAWVLTLDANNLATLRPSVWRTKGCRSHFFLRHGSIVWCRSSMWFRWRR